MAELAMVELAYAAGILDGEGCVSLEKANGRPNKRGYRISLFATISNTNKPLLQWLKDKFGGQVKQYKKRVGRKTCWVWRICAKQAAEFLEAVRPYLIVKLSEVDLALEFQKEKVIGQSLTDTQDELQVSQYLKMRELKKEGLS